MDMKNERSSTSPLVMPSPDGADELRKQVCPVCHNEEYPEGARFCMICGTPLEGCEGCAYEDAGRDQDCCWNCSRNGRRTRTDLYRRKI